MNRGTSYSAGGVSILPKGVALRGEAALAGRTLRPNNLPPNMAANNLR